MTEHIDTRFYDSQEPFHAGWQKAMEWITTDITAMANNLQPLPLKILEMGPFQGNSTQVLANGLAQWQNQSPSNRQWQLTTVEYDSTAIPQLSERFKNEPAVVTVNQSILEYIPQTKQQAFTATFALTHLPKAQRKQLFEHLKQHVLTPVGTLYIAEECFAEHNEQAPLAHQWAAIKHHFNVIADALFHKRFQLAFMEYQAYRSDGQGDFKTTVSKMIDELEQAGFSVETRKMYPLKQNQAGQHDIAPFGYEHSGGVYVFKACLQQPSKPEH
ncbi:MAG: hypothetical protein SFZ03_10890 [Candidatus Melainabacteria bacterium]|nr:hypothetical protein [Candidatus Melainabacteria bacterium]